MLFTGLVLVVFPIATDALPHILQSSRQFYRLLVSKNQEIMIFTAKKKPMACGYLGPGISEKPKKLRLFSLEKKA